MTDDEGHGGGKVVGPLCLVPSGKYEVAYLSYETGIYWGQPKVVVHFSVINHDIYAGTEVGPDGALYSGALWGMMRLRP